MTKPGAASVPWSAEEEAILVANPGMTARELAALLPGRSVQAVKRHRSRTGPFPRKSARLCVRCDGRPVYAESPKAARWGLCKGCYLDERERRLAEARRDAAIRQRERTARKGGQSGEPGTLKGTSGGD